ncbi:MAG: phosphomannomutase/phosphoglucomutase [Chloroflexi bacterium]|nr:phosphomannomutase/phosphoglucomutase [Chloroflexota bacterium]
MSIFKAYDVRGIYPDELDEEAAWKIGVALANYLGAGPVVVGRDMRLSSPALSDSLRRGIADGGAAVWDVGLCSTDMVTYVVGAHGAAGGVMVTASHNPAEWNGFKFCRLGGEPLSGKVGLDAMERAIVEGRLRTASAPAPIEQRHFRDDYVRHLLSFIDPSRLRPLTVVVDAGNGIAGLLVPEVARHLPIGVIPLYFELDGRFPNHPASPIEEQNQADCKARVLAERADLGILFDGDADRIFLVDETGEGVSGTLLTALIARQMLRRHPGATILYNAVCGRIVPATIARHGGRGVRTPVGHSLIKARMRQENALFAGEHSGHYFFRDNYYADSGLIAALLVLELISEDGRPLSEIVREYRTHVASGEINSRVADPLAKIEELARRYADGKSCRLDGLTVEYPDWWFNVRPSNTEPLLRLNVEAETRERMEARRDELLRLIRS